MLIFTRETRRKGKRVLVATCINEFHKEHTLDLLGGMSRETGRWQFMLAHSVASDRPEFRGHDLTLTGEPNPRGGYVWSVAITDKNRGGAS